MAQTAPAAKRRSEQEGILRFTREMVSALLMALVAIVYVIQAFRIPSGSMESSLLIGDFLLGLKFMYGSPVLPFVTYRKFPGVTDPKPGDVIIFKYPGLDRKDYIKRCVAGPGDTIQIDRTVVKVNGKTLALPPRGQYVMGGDLRYDGISHFAPLRIPAKGDTIEVEKLGAREFVFLKNLVRQEYPRSNVRSQLQMYVDGEYNRGFPIDSVDIWIGLEYQINNTLAQARSELPGRTVEMRNMLLIDDKPVTRYVVKMDNYFMLGDNRDNSMDSRFWGYLNRNFVKAKAFILYFSLDSEVPWWQLPLKIRWDRIGKLIRSWDGASQAETVTRVR